MSNIDFDYLRTELSVPDGEGILDWIESLPEPLRTDGHHLLNQVEAKAAEESQAATGSEDLIRWVRQEEIPFGILTRNTRATWEVVSNRFPFLNPDIVVTREEGQPKPHPDCLRPFLERWNVIAESIVHVGDYRYDLELAHTTGMHSVLIQSQKVNPYPVPCHKVVSDLTDLLGYLKALPIQGKDYLTK